MALERRQDRRVKEDFSILCRIYEKKPIDPNVSRIIDISRRGVCFLLDNRLAKNNILQMIFRLPPDFKEKIEIFGRVVDSQPQADKFHITRVAFIDIDEKAKAILNRIIERASLRETLKLK